MLVNIHILQLVWLSFLLYGIQVQAQAPVWSLESCIDTAMVHNKTIQIAQNEGEIARLKNREANAQRLPKLSLQGDYRYFTELPYQLMPQSAFGGPEGVFREVQFGVPHNISANLSLKMPLYDPQLMGSIRASQTYQELSLLQEAKTKEQVYLEVANLYYNAQILKNQLRFLHENLSNGQRLEKNTRLLYEQTLAQRTDWDKVRLQNQQLESKASQVESHYETVLNALKFVMGLPLHTEIGVSLHIDRTEPERESMRHTLDERMQEKKQQLKQHELLTLRQSKIPSLSLVGNYGRTGFGYTGNPEAFLDFYPVSFVGIQLSVPLFNGTVTRRKMDQRRIELQNSHLQQEQIAEQADMAYQNALLQTQVAENLLQTSQQQIDLAASVYQKTLLQQQEGLAGLTEVLLADNALRDAQQQYLNVLVDYLKATLERKKTSGNLLN